jgi:hypothetical protein
MKRQPTVAEIVMFAGGAITFIFSFLPFIGVGSESKSAWGSLFGLFPNTTIIAILGLAMAVFVALEIFVGFTLPTFLTFTYKQMYVTWGVVAGVFMLAYLITDKGGTDSKAGLYLMLVGGLAMGVGSILNVLGLANQPVGPKAAGAAPGAGPSLGGGPSVGGGPATPPPPPSAGPSAPPPPPPSSGPSTPPPPPPPV